MTEPNDPPRVLDDEDGHVDGNAVAGVLSALFVPEMTSAHLRCAACERVGPVAEVMAWVRGPGIVVRCPGCTAVLIRVVQTPRSWRVDLLGTAELALETPTDGGEAAGG